MPVEQVETNADVDQDHDLDQDGMIVYDPTLKDVFCSEKEEDQEADMTKPSTKRARASHRAQTRASTSSQREPVRRRRSARQCQVYRRVSDSDKSDSSTDDDDDDEHEAQTPEKGRESSQADQAFVTPGGRTMWNRGKQMAEYPTGKLQNGSERKRKAAAKQRKKTRAERELSAEV